MMTKRKQNSSDWIHKVRAEDQKRNMGKTPAQIIKDTRERARAVRKEIAS